MIKKTFSFVALLALAACQRQEPAASPPVAGTEPAPVAEAAPPSAAPAPAPVALPPATPEERVKFFQACWASFNAKDWQKFQGCYAEAASSEQVDMGFPTATGRSAIVEKSAKQYAAAFPDGTGEAQLTPSRLAGIGASVFEHSSTQTRRPPS